MLIWDPSTHGGLTSKRQISLRILHWYCYPWLSFGTSEYPYLEKRRSSHFLRLEARKWTTNVFYRDSKQIQGDCGFHLQAHLLEQTSTYTESESRSLDNHHLHPDHPGAQHHHDLLPIPQTVLRQCRVWLHEEWRYSSTRHKWLLWPQQWRLIC